MPNIFKKSLAITAPIALIWFMYQALNIALADIKHYPVKHWIKKIETGQAITKADIDMAIITIQSAIKKTPNNPEYREYLARLYFLSAIDVYNKDNNNLKAFRADLVNAYIQHKTALKHRPQWPYSWANLALIKAHLQQYDNEFENAIINAEKFGPWEIASNQAIAMAGLTGWNSISADLQTKTVAAIERTYQQDKRIAKNLMTTYRLTSQICEKVTLIRLSQDKVCKNT